MTSTARYLPGLFFFCDGAALASWIARIPETQQHLRLDDSQMGMALLGTAVGCLVANSLSIGWTERWGNVRVATVSALAFCLTLPWPVTVQSQWALFAALLAVGLCSGSLNVAQNAYAAAVEKRLGRPMMVGYHGLYSLGGLTGAIVGAGAVALSMPSLWHLAMVGLAIAASVLLKPMSDAVMDVASTPSTSSANRRLSLLATLAFATVLLEGAIGDWSGIYLARVAHAPPAVTALGFASFSIAMVIGRFYGDRFHGRHLLQFGGLLAALGMTTVLLSGVLLTSSAWPLQLAGFAAVGLGCAGTYPVLAREAGSARAIAVVSSLGFFGFLAGPPLIGLLSTHIGLTWALSTLVAAALVVSMGGQVLEKD